MMLGAILDFYIMAAPMNTNYGILSELIHDVLVLICSKLYNVRHICTIAANGSNIAWTYPKISPLTSYLAKNNIFYIKMQFRFGFCMVKNLEKEVQILLLWLLVLKLWQIQMARAAISDFVQYGDSNERRLRCPQKLNSVCSMLHLCQMSRF